MALSLDASATHIHLLGSGVGAQPPPNPGPPGGNGPPGLKRSSAPSRVLRNAGLHRAHRSHARERGSAAARPGARGLGRLLFFDKVLGLHNDNSCAGCHSPAFGFGDSQPMAIGVDNNDIVGPNRHGPRNQRRSPLVANTIFYPALMWTPRFVALSGDPSTLRSVSSFRRPRRHHHRRADAAGGAGLAAFDRAGGDGRVHRHHRQPRPFGPRHFQFDDGHGEPLPAPDATGFHNFPIQAAVDARLNAIPATSRSSASVFNGGIPLPPGGITISMRRRAIAEFQTVPDGRERAARPLRARRQRRDDAQARSAARCSSSARRDCVACHAVAGPSNEMFSDFKPHRIGGPQVAPLFGVGLGNVIFDGPGENEDFGFEQTEGDPALRYMFRTAPLRNLEVAPAFFHNGAFGTLEAAIAHHLDVEARCATTTRLRTSCLRTCVGPFEGILAAGIDPLLRKPIRLDKQEFRDLVEFVRDGLFDERVLDFCEQIPASVPSGMPLQTLPRLRLSARARMALCVTQRLDRFAGRGLVRRVIAEEETDCGREQHRNSNHDGMEDGRHARPDGEDLRCAHAERDACSPADRTQHDGFGQELLKNIRALRADRPAYPDLSSPLHHGDEHDVHDADAADEQGDGSDDHEHGLENLRRPAHGFRGNRSSRAPGTSSLAPAFKRWRCRSRASVCSLTAPRTRVSATLIMIRSTAPGVVGWRPTRRVRAAAKGMRMTSF